MRHFKLYICNRKAIIADGVCDGSGCMDCGEPCCNHTSYLKYAKYDQSKDITDWEAIPTYDYETGQRMIMTEWEIDPEEAKKSYS